MSLETFSKFYFDFEITSENNLLNFNEGSGELTATIQIGSYTLTQVLSEVKKAMDTAGTQVYTVSVDRDTRLVTISAGSSFDLLISSGSNVGTDPFGLLGFSGADLTGATTYTGTAAVGQVYEPQYILQDHIASENSQQSVDATVNRTASGKIEVIRFGTEKFVQMNIMFITDIAQGGNGPIKTNATGIADAQAFMQHLTLKRPVEFMPDITDTSTFEQLILESTRFNRDGVGYELNEMFNRNLAKYFETGVLRFRVIT